MTDSDRMQLCHVRETELGVTPTTPRMRKQRFTGESLSFAPVFEQSAEINPDRMRSDPFKTNETHSGAVNGELSFPPDNSPFSDDLESVFCNVWSNTPSRDNDGTADSVITDVAETGGVITCTTGDAFVAGHLVRLSGFGEVGNAGLFAITTGSATVPAVGSSLLTDESAPGGDARVKVVGLQGASGDITATATGLASTVLDFTTMNLVVGQWLKIGGLGSGFRFGTEALNGWARVSATPTANALSLDNLPSGWTTDAGTSKTIRVFFGDQLKNGVLVLGATKERGFLGQATPTYIREEGMVVGQGEYDLPMDGKATWTHTFTGMTGEIGTTPLDASPDAASTNQIMAAGVNAGRIAENGAIVSTPDFMKSLKIGVNNNIRTKTGYRGGDGKVGAVGLGVGKCDVTVSSEFYFGSSALVTKLRAGAPTNLNARLAKNSQALVFGIPRITFTEGMPNGSGENQDVMQSMTAMASRDADTGAHVTLDRLEYFEA